MGHHPVRASAPGKIILFGEHAVVYGQPAIAAPVHQVAAKATVAPAAAGRGLTLCALDLDLTTPFDDADADDPLVKIVRLTLAHLNSPAPDATLTVRSTIPIASGLGSGAAVSTAVVRALAAYLGRELAARTVSQLVYEVEKLHHGTPSGIDNTVVVYGMPVYFVRGQPVDTFDVGAPVHLIIADTGIASPTRLAVQDVRRGWKKERRRYERLFSLTGEVARRARQLIESGADTVALGKLMNRNHELLRQMGVSSPELERLVTAAREAGAWGAKLSGAGRGGNALALVAPGREAQVKRALSAAGARRLIQTALPATGAGGAARGPGP